jgi:hypothetical protein
MANLRNFVTLFVFPAEQYCKTECQLFFHASPNSQFIIYSPQSCLDSTLLTYAFGNTELNQLILIYLRTLFTMWIREVAVRLKLQCTWTKVSHIIIWHFNWLSWVCSEDNKDVASRKALIVFLKFLTALLFIRLFTYFQICRQKTPFSNLRVSKQNIVQEAY